MPRLTIFVLTILCLFSVGFAALANDGGVSAAMLQTQSPDAGRLLAMEIAARAQGGNAQGKFTPSQPRAPMIAPPMAAAGPVPTAAPALTCGGTPAANKVSAADGGMRFMPLRRAMPAREFPLPSRGEITATAQTLRAAVAGSKGESDLAQTALQVANLPTAQAQAATELANYTGHAAPSSADPSQAAANQAVLREIQRYRATHGAF